MRGRRAPPQFVTLIGVPGIGKSRLIAELLAAVDIDSEMIWWRQGRCLPYGAGISFWALGEMAKAQAGVLETDDAEQAEAKLRDAVTTLVADPSEAEWVLSHLRPLLGLPGATAEQSERFAAWRRFFEALGEVRPAVLVFEDLHWADDGLLDFVDYLAEWAVTVPLLLVCTARPELLDRRPGWGGGKRNATSVSLSPLSDDEVGRLISALLERSVLPAETRSELLRRADGNPLYAEEYVRALREGRRPEEALPENVQGIIAARLDTLAAEDKALLQDAAVVGKVFWLGAVTAVGNLVRAGAEQRLHALERREFIRSARRGSVSGDVEYAFRHVLVRDVAYNQIPRLPARPSTSLPPRGSARSAAIARRITPRCLPTITARRCSCFRRRGSRPRRSPAWRGRHVSRPASGRAAGSSGQRPGALRRCACADGRE